MARTDSPRRVQLRIETMAAMLLLVVLASLTVLLSFTTAIAYRHLTSESDGAQELRTGLLFVATKVRQTDGTAAVRQSPWGSALVLSQTAGGQTYEDWIFFYKGTLREGTVPAGTTINPPACQVISTLRSFTFEQAGSRLRLTAAASSPQTGAEAQTDSLTLTLRS